VPIRGIRGSKKFMTIKDNEHVDLTTPSGPMRTYFFRPQAPGKYPGILLYSEIFQVTGPIRRTAALLAGHGFFVAVPEIYHEFEPAGTVLAYDQAGADRGNALKTTKELAAYDTDARAVLAFLKNYEHCTGDLGVMGICIGGHLAFRAAMNPEVLAATCFYATDIHKRGLGKGMNDNSLDRIPEIKGELLMIWGRQDPHVPADGRAKSTPRSRPPARTSPGSNSTAPMPSCATRATATIPSSPSSATAAR
jgi:carboxymethylenebutenolidase